MVFYVTPGINADFMYVKDGRMCMVQGNSSKLPGDMVPIGDSQNIATRARDPVSFPYLYVGPGKSPVLGIWRGFPASTSAAKSVPTSNVMATTEPLPTL
jgi:hypothetical protein